MKREGTGLNMAIITAMNRSTFGKKAVAGSGDSESGNNSPMLKR